MAAPGRDHASPLARLQTGETGQVPCIIGEVSTVNDDVAVNHFTDPAVGRFPDIDEDVPADPSLCWETQAAR